jgi:hypothetical protein
LRQSRQYTLTWTRPTNSVATQSGQAIANLGARRSRNLHMGSSEHGPVALVLALHWP